MVPGVLPQGLELVLKSVLCKVFVVHISVCSLQYAECIKQLRVVYLVVVPPLLPAPPLPARLPHLGLLLLLDHLEDVRPGEGGDTRREREPA